ncbi:hypothetical protein GCM10010967_23060 [Dyadobacter beijingensis]|uniref:Uncharacterized protein n=2 Tax=Dyadobacter beijingensis TaxID=365489 RepID=A0ABQ2HRM4_9BACT|nr:hypothetical protein GCM10010967_23060 [Dyadobacter beijingensis]
MGINIGRQDWKAAMHWALKAAEADPAEKYWRYLNAADFASRDGNREAAIRYAALVVDSDIAANARFGPSFAWLQDDPAWQQLMHKVAGIREAARQAKIKASLVFRDEQKMREAETAAFMASLAEARSAQDLYRKIRQGRPVHQYPKGRHFVYAWAKLADTLEFPYLVQLPPGFDGTN